MPDEGDTASKVTVRDATVDDAPEIHALAVELAGAVGDALPDPDNVKTRLRELLKAPEAGVYVAEGEDGVVGVVSLWIKPDLAHGDTVVEVPMLAVSEKARRNGVGKLLMTTVQEIAAENEADLIELVATRSNVAAREFYQSLGFIEANVVALEFVGDVETPPDPEAWGD